MFVCTISLSLSKYSKVLFISHVMVLRGAIVVASKISLTNIEFSKESGEKTCTPLTRRYYYQLEIKLIFWVTVTSYSTTFNKVSINESQLEKRGNMEIDR